MRSIIEPLIVVIEGAEYASALSSYLKTCCGFKVINYEPEKNNFVKLLDDIIFQQDTPRLVVCKAHLTALAKGVITVAYFKEFEQALALTKTKLVLAVSQSDTTNSGILADGYAHSWLVKRTYQDGDTITNLLDWLGIRPDVEARNGIR